MSDLLQELAELERVLYATPSNRLAPLHLFCTRQSQNASPPSAEFWGALGTVVGQALLNVRRWEK